MVFSNIDKSLEYDESTKIDKQDHEFESLIYPIEITYHDDLGKPRTREINIVFGKKNTKYLKTKFNYRHFRRRTTWANDLRGGTQAWLQSSNFL